MSWRSAWERIVVKRATLPVVLTVAAAIGLTACASKTETVSTAPPPPPPAPRCPPPPAGGPLWGSRPDAEALCVEEEARAPCAAPREEDDHHDNDDHGAEPLTVVHLA